MSHPQFSTLARKSPDGSRLLCVLRSCLLLARKPFVLSLAILVLLNACSKSESPSGDLGSEESSVTPEREAVREATIPEIVPEGQTKETVSEWSGVIKKELISIEMAILDPKQGLDSIHSLNGPVRSFDPSRSQSDQLHRGPSIGVTEVETHDDTYVVDADAPTFLQNLRQIFQLDPSVKDQRAHFKLFSINREGEFLKTRQRLTALTTVQGKRLQSLAVIDATWKIPASGSDESWPQLDSWSMPKIVYSETTLGENRGFEDIAGRVLGGNAAWKEQLQWGMNTWRRHIERSLNPDFLGYHGLAIRDVNGDGLEDLYVCQPGGLPNLLFQQNPDGSLVDISTISGVDWLDNSTGALLVDLDNDGDADLALATRTAFLVMENDGTGGFSLMQQMNNLGMGFSPTAVDYDKDGDLDLYVLRYAADGKVGDFPTPHPFHSARNGGANVLLRNEGGLEFSDVTDECGLGFENFRFSFAASWEDYDNDGDMDVYIANDFGPNQLFRNDSGRFVDQSEPSRTQDWGFGMSATWADYNRDGHMDLYVSSMFSGAGNQVVAQADFNANMPKETRDKYLKMVRGNSLLKNGGNGQFTDVTKPMSEGFGRWAWGTKFGDFDNDGWEDLYVANGYISQPDTDDL